jgi:hypothetical protein
MTALAVTAGQSLPSFKLERPDLPSEFGVLYFASLLPAKKDIPANRIRAVTWGLSQPFANRPGVWLSFWGDTSAAVQWAKDDGAYSEEMAADILRWAPAVMHMRAGFMQFGDPDREAVEKLTPATLAVRAAWLLMVQQIPAIHPLRPRRSELRAMRRRGLDPRGVRIVSLRHRKTEPVGDCADGRVYSHRWVVKGHWRNQWYPSQQRHVPLWIHAHVKGPEGAPMLTGEVVSAWRR